MGTFAAELKALGACGAAVTWVGRRSLKRAWEECERGDWMLWYLCRTDALTKEQAVRIAALCARECLHLVPEGEDRPRLAVEAAERWLAEPTTENESAAKSAAKSAAWSATESAARSAKSAARSAESAARERQAEIVRSVVPCLK